MPISVFVHIQFDGTFSLFYIAFSTFPVRPYIIFVTFSWLMIQHWDHPLAFQVEYYQDEKFRDQLYLIWS